MKKIAVVALLLMATLLAVVGCNKGGDPTVESISVSKNPTKTIYAIGDSFDPTGGEITAKLTNGKAEVIAMTDEDVTFEGFSSATHTGTSSLAVTVKYKEKTTTTSVKVVAPSQISIANTPKLVYSIGESFDRSQGSIRVTKSDNTFEIIPLSDSRVGIANYDANTTGVDMPITITFGSLSMTALVTVRDATISNISISEAQYPTKMDYWTDESFAPAGGSIIVTKADSSTSTVALDSSDIKIVEDFSHRSDINPDNDTARIVKIQYRGHQTTLKVNLRAEVESISIGTSPVPQSSYVVNENFYRSYGSIVVNYVDGLKQNVPLSNSSIDVIGYDPTETGLGENGTKTMQVHFTYPGIIKADPGTRLFETNKMDVTVSLTAASPVMAHLNSLSHIAIDWVGYTFENASPTDLENIGTMFAAYHALNSAQKNSIRNYQPRIVGLAFAADYMELITRSNTISTMKLNTLSYETVDDDIPTLQSFVDDVAALNAAASSGGKYYDYDTVVFYQQGNTIINIRNLNNTLSTVRNGANTLIGSINRLITLFSGYSDIPTSLPHGYNFFTNHPTIQAAYDQLKVTAIEDARVYLPALEAWRSDYLDIMLEFLYQKNGNSIYTTIDDKTDINSEILGLVELAPPNAIADLMTLGLKNLNYGGNFLSMGHCAPFFAYLNLMRDTMVETYSNGYPSAIDVIEQVPLVYEMSIRQVYDLCLNDEYPVFMQFSGSTNKPTGKVKEFLDIYFPIVEKFVDYLYLKDLTDYQPDSDEFLEDVNTIRDNFFALPSSDQYVVLGYYNYNFYYSYIRAYLQSAFGDNPNSDTGSNETQTYDATSQVLINYIIYCATGATEDLTNLKTSLNEFNTIFNASNKDKLNQYIPLELEYVSKVEEWVYDMEHLPEGILLINTLLANANSTLSSGLLDDHAALYLELTDAVAAIDGKADSIDFYESYGVDAFDGNTHEEIYLSHQNTVMSAYPAFTTEGAFSADTEAAEKALFDAYFAALRKAKTVVGYEPGNEDYEADVANLRTLLFDDMNMAKTLNFAAKGHYIMNSRLLWSFINRHVASNLEDAAEDAELDELNTAKALVTYESLLNIIYAAWLYDVGYLSADSLKFYVEQYDTLYDALGDAKGIFDTEAASEMAYIAEFVAFAEHLFDTGNAAHDNVLRLTSIAIEKYHASENALSDAYYRKAQAAFDALEDKETFADTVLIPGSESTVGSILSTLETAHKTIMIRNMADDDDSLDIYNFFIEVLYKFYELEGYYEGDFSTDITTLVNKYFALSAYQQGSFLKFQTGSYDGATVNYFSLFLDDYFLADFDSEDDEDNIDQEILDAIYATSDSSLVFALFNADSYTYTDMMTIFKEAKDAYAALSDTQKTEFKEANVYNMYERIAAIYDAYMTASETDLDGKVVEVFDTLVRVVEAKKLADSIADYTYFMRYISYFQSSYASLAANSEKYASDLGKIEYDGKKVSVWINEINTMISELPEFENLGTLVSTFMFFAERFFAAGGAIDITYFDDSAYFGDIIGDIDTITAHYNRLSETNKAIFLDTFGYTYRAMLRYYYSQETVDADEYIRWYEGYMTPATAE